MRFVQVGMACGFARHWRRKLCDTFRGVNQRRWLAGTVTRLFHCSFPLNQRSLKPVTPLFIRAEDYRERVAIVDSRGSHQYSDILHYATVLANKLSFMFQDKATSVPFPLANQRVSILCTNDVSYSIAQWAVWMNGGTVVPLCSSHPESQMKYFIDDSDSCLIIAVEEFRSLAASLGASCNVDHVILEDSDCQTAVDIVDDVEAAVDVHMSSDAHQLRERRCSHWQGLLENDGFKEMNATIIYTSGTTGRPKVGLYSVSMVTIG